MKFNGKQEISVKEICILVKEICIETFYFRVNCKLYVGPFLQNWILVNA